MTLTIPPDPIWRCGHCGVRVEAPRPGTVHDCARESRRFSGRVAVLCGLLILVIVIAAYLGRGA